MSDKSSSDLQLPEQDAGLLFRAEMWATNAILGYWKHLVAVVVVALLAILIYGQYTSVQRRNQRAASAEISEAWADLPREAIPGQETAEQLAEIRAVADELARIGGESGGAASAEAWLKAAELYRTAEAPEQQRVAFEHAAETADGALLYAARSGIANLAIEAGDVETAAAQYRQLMDELDGYLAQQAALDLGLAYEFADRQADARSLYLEFQGRWPESPRLTEVAERLAALGEGEGTAPEEPAGAGTEPAPTEEVAPAPTEGADAPQEPAAPADAGTEPAPTEEATPAPTEGAAPAPTEPSAG